MSTKKHTVYNTVGALIPLAVALLTIPAYLNTIGDVRYGVLMLAWVLLGNFGVFDLGLGRALAQRIAALRDAKPSQRAAAFWTVLGANAVFGLVGGLILLPVGAYFFSRMASIPPEIRGEIDIANVWLALAVPITTISGALTGALQGDALFLRLNVSTIFGAVLFQLLPLFVALSGHVELSALMPAVIVARVLSMGALMIACRDYLRSFTRAVWSMPELSRMMKAGGWISLTTVVSPIVLASDRVAIGVLSGTSAVTSYGVPYQLGERSTIFSYAMASALFPRFATASASEGLRLARDGQKFVAVVMTPAIMAAIVLLEPFLSWWVSEEFAERSALAGQVLLVGFWLSGFSKIPHMQLQATGRPDLVAKTILLQIIPYGLALYFAVTAFGAVGAAMAFAAKAAMEAGMLAWLTAALGTTTRLLAVPALLLAALSVPLVLGSSGMGFQSGLLVVFLAVTAWSWRSTPDQYKDLVKRKFGNLLREGDRR